MAGIEVIEAVAAAKMACRSSRSLQLTSPSGLASRVSSPSRTCAAAGEGEGHVNLPDL